MNRLAPGAGLNFRLAPGIGPGKVSSSQAKIDANFSNYFLKTKANNKCIVVLKCTCKGQQKFINE